jgi:CRISPR system Cascade subunit CasA
MNLTTDAWIPIVWADGRASTVSLRGAFERSEEIRDLAVRAHERIALMRLLICISQAALDGPADHDGWEACRPRIAASALDYLNRWRHAFELFGGGPRFAQVANLRRLSGKSGGQGGEDSSASKLDLALAAGNNTTLFDNAGGSERTFTDARLALTLLSFQCFSPGGRIGVALWNGKETAGKGSSNHAPCLAGGALHAALRGDNLSDTLHRNLLSKHQVEQFFGADSWGRPVWEQTPAGPTDAAARHNASRTYLGRLLPLTRAIWFGDDRRSLILANGLEYGSYAEAGWREPSTTIVTQSRKGQPARVVLPASVEKAAWRELHALMVKAINQNTIGGPAALQNIFEEEAFDLWVGGLVADKAKPVDTVESVFHIPAAMLDETSRKLYEKGVRLAETTAFGVMRAVAVYHTELGDKLDRGEMKQRRQQMQSKAAAQFWTDIEQTVPHLLEAAAALDSLGPKGEWHKTSWGKSVWRAALATYERACPHGTARQLRAYAAGLAALRNQPGRKAASIAEDGHDDNPTEGEE